MATGDTPPRIPSRVCPKRGGKGSLTFRGTTKSWPRRRRRRTHHRQRTRPDTCRRCSGNQAVNNGRLARVMMNTELVSGAQSRIIIPTVFREDYLGGLRKMTRRSDPSALIKSLRYGHDYTARIDFSTLAGATEVLLATNAFNEPGSSDRLQLPPALT